MKSAPNAPRPVKVAGYTCFNCKDQGYFYKDRLPGQAGFGVAFVCTCRTQGVQERQYRRLMEIDRLTIEERKVRFATLICREGNAEAIESVQYTLERKRGIVTLMGKPGRGKSTLLIAAVNEAREANIPAIYYRVSDLLDYLRRAYDPAAEVHSDQHWQLLTTVEILALDELDQFKTTEWAMEKFLSLIDQRWRNLNQTVTLVATNTPIHLLPDKVSSRLQDRRNNICQITGPDMRKLNTWETA